MKNIKFRSWILYLLICCFFLGVGFYIYEFIMNAHMWAFAPFNGHLSENSISGGRILDSNGVVLAQSKNGKRLYHEDENIRKAVLHIVGDGSTLIPTSIQSRYSKELFGYNLITGFGAPKILNMSQDIKLTLDSGVCAKVSKSFKDKHGAAVAYNYLTGEILCMVSLPTYDVNHRPDLSKDNDHRYKGVYINRVLSSSYTPGSIFKVFTAIAALDNIPDVEKRNFKCNKIKVINAEKVVCMQNHGMINLMNGMLKSCDIVFGDLGIELGRDRMKSKMEELGFNKSQFFDGIKIAISEYNVSDASDADLAWSAIGQYNDRVNPMHVMKIMGAIANDGKSVEPHIVKSIFSDSYSFVQDFEGVSEQSIINQQTANRIKEIMRYTVKNGNSNSLFQGLEICAKTGTAEVGDNKLPHGWITGFSSDKKFPVAFSVVVEHGDFGVKSAGPIASIMMRELKKSIYSDKYL